MGTDSSPSSIGLQAGASLLLAEGDRWAQGSLGEGGWGDGRLRSWDAGSHVGFPKKTGRGYTRARNTRAHGGLLPRLVWEGSAFYFRT